MAQPEPTSSNDHLHPVHWIAREHKEMIRSHIQDLAEHANLLAKRAMRPACSRGLPFAKRKIEVVRNCLVSRRGGLARGTKQKFAHRSKHRVPSATVSCAAQKRVDKRGLYMYIHVL